ncbi:MAG: VTT domain-containing protein [Bacillota bacterium]
MNKTALKIIFATSLFILLYYFWEDIQALQINKIVNDVDNRLNAIIIILSFFALKSLFFFIPLFLIFISSGMVMPIIPAAFVSILGVGIEFSLTYIYGYFLGAEYVERLISKNKKFKEVLNYRLDNNIRVAFFFRLTPVMPEAVSLVLGATGSNYLEYILASIMGIIPKLLIFTLIGNAVINPITSGDVIAFTTAILFWLAALRIFQVKENKNGQEQSELLTE